MARPWKLIGLAGLAGVAATGVVVARRRRAQQDYDPAELRERLHRRLAEAGATDPSAGAEGEPAARPGDGPAAPSGGGTGTPQP
jgi:hypothetical protein